MQPIYIKSLELQQENNSMQDFSRMEISKLLLISSARKEAPPSGDCIIRYRDYRQGYEADKKQRLIYNASHTLIFRLCDI